MSNLLNLKKGTMEASDVKPTVEVYADAGAIAIKTHVAMLTKATAQAMTLRAPTVSEGGTVITVVCTTAAAHTVTATTIGFNAGDAASDVCTFSAAIGNLIEVVAYNGEWYVLRNVGGTLA